MQHSKCKYKSHIEKFYEKHEWYQNLVFFSKVARMMLYVILGVSVILFVINGVSLKTFESFIYDLVKISVGKIIAITFGILLIIYGLEKPRG